MKKQHISRRLIKKQFIALITAIGEINYKLLTYAIKLSNILKKVELIFDKQARVTIGGFNYCIASHKYRFRRFHHRSVLINLITDKYAEN